MPFFTSKSMISPKRPLWLASAALTLGLITVGCSGPQTIPVNYAPSSVMTASGTVSVTDFTYRPAEVAPPGKTVVASNQIRNTAMGNIMIDRDVKVFVRDAVFSELRLVGIKTIENDRVLKGEIEEFLIDDLGYNVDWTLRIKYTIVDSAAKKELYSSVKNIQRRTAKFANVFGALNETIKMNAEELLKDPLFIKAIN